MRRRIPVAAVALALAVAARAEIPRAARPTPSRPGPAAARLPVRFEENRGQVAAPARFLARARGFTLFVAPGEAVVAGHDGAVLRMRLEGAAPVEPLPSERQPGTTNYFRGNDRARWLRGVPGWGRVEQSGVLPGVDLVFRGSPEGPEYDLRLAPGVDPARAVLAFEGAEGLSVDAAGDLVVRLARGEVRHGRPRAWQDLPGGRRAVEARFAVLDRRRVAFALGERDPAYPLVVDPPLAYSSYLGGSGGDYVNTAALDPSGNLCVLGSTTSSDFPVASAYQSTIRCSNDLFLTKCSPDGTSLVFSTYFGGNASCDGSLSPDAGYALAVDGTGRLFVAGAAGSSTYPVMNPLQGWGGGSNSARDATVSVFSADGNYLLFSTFLGGSGQDAAHGVGLGDDGSIYLAGETSGSFPVTAGAYETDFAGGTDAFVARINATWDAVSWATYLGGSSLDSVGGLQVASSGEALVAGTTVSTDFPQQASLQPDYEGGQEGWVAAIAATGATLAFSTHLGGTANDEVLCTALDASGGLLVGGETRSSDFPVVGAAQGTLSGTRDGFVARLAPNRGSWTWCTYLGGSGSESVNAVAPGESGTTWVAGHTTSTAYPVTGGAPQGNYGGGSRDAVLAQLAAGGGSVAFATYCGGSDQDAAFGLGVEPGGGVWIAGETSSTNLSVTGDALQDAPGGTVEAFLRRYAEAAPPPPPPPPAIPTAPDGFAASPLSGSVIALSWNDNSDNETGFGLLRAVDGGNFQSLTTVAAGTVAWEDEGLVPDRAYAYRLRAIGASGSSAYTPAVAARTLGTLDVGISRGEIADGDRLGRDRFELQGTFQLNGAAEDGLADPIQQGLVVTLGDAGEIALVSIPIADGGWRSKHSRWTWKSPKSDARRVKVTLIPSLHALRVTVGGLELPTPLANPVRVRVSVGNDAGSLVGTWTPHPRKDGVLLYP